MLKIPPLEDRLFNEQFPLKEMKDIFLFFAALGASTNEESKRKARAWVERNRTVTPSILDSLIPSFSAFLLTEFSLIPIGNHQFFVEMMQQLNNALKGLRMFMHELDRYKCMYIILFHHIKVFQSIPPRSSED